MSKKQQVYPVDTSCKIKGEVLVDDTTAYTCTLNQTNINANNNKFYIMQIVCDTSNFHLYTRYGRIGLDGVSSTKQFSSKTQAIGAFNKQFKSKTGNTWGDTFEKKQGKYFMSDVAYEVDESDISSEDEKKDNTKLDDRVKFLMGLLTDKDMMERTLVQLSIDRNIRT